MLKYVLVSFAMFLPHMEKSYRLHIPIIQLFTEILST